MLIENISEKCKKISGATTTLQLNKQVWFRIRVIVWLLCSLKYNTNKLLEASDQMCRAVCNSTDCNCIVSCQGSYTVLCHPQIPQANQFFSLWVFKKLLLFALQQPSRKSAVSGNYWWTFQSIHNWIGCRIKFRWLFLLCIFKEQTVEKWCLWLLKKHLAANGH